MKHCEDLEHYDYTHYAFNQAGCLDNRTLRCPLDGWFLGTASGSVGCAKGSRERQEVNCSLHLRASCVVQRRRLSAPQQYLNRLTDSRKRWQLSLREQLLSHALLLRSGTEGADESTQT